MTAPKEVGVEAAANELVELASSAGIWGLTYRRALRIVRRLIKTYLDHADD